MKFNPKGRISGLEFLVSVLTYGNFVDKEKDIDPILAKFSYLDKDKDGFIQPSDLTGNQSDADSTVGLPEIVFKDFLEVLFGNARNVSTDDTGRLISGETLNSSAPVSSSA